MGLLGQFGIGAPAATAVLEQLAALGTTAVVSVGTAGSLTRPGTRRHRAVRGRRQGRGGLAPLPAAGPAGHRPGGNDRRPGRGPAESGLAFRPGVSWTIDAPYRETVAEARHYQAEGVLCVEMEAAALFAVAEVRGLRLASAFVISDSLADLVWSPRFHDPAVQGPDRLYQAAVAVLTDPDS